jgi:hypothetical protein
MVFQNRQRERRNTIRRRENSRKVCDAIIGSLKSDGRRYPGWSHLQSVRIGEIGQAKSKKRLRSRSQWRKYCGCFPKREEQTELFAGTFASGGLPSSDFG